MEEHNDYERIGIRSVHSVLKKATQSNLSMFHVSGGVHGSILPRPSIVNILNGDRTENCYMSVKVKNKNMMSKMLVGNKLSDFIVYFTKSKFLKEDNPEDVFYSFLGVSAPDKFVRFYLDPKLFCKAGYTLDEIAKLSFSEYTYYTSPDFMGIIDVDISHLESNKIIDIFDLDVHLGGSSKIKYCFIEDDTLFTIGSDIEALILLNDYIDVSTIYSNDIYDVEKVFGIGAVRRLLIELIDDKDFVNVIPDFLIRTGRFLHFKKECIKLYERGFISEMSFEQLKNSLEDIPNGTFDPLNSIYSKIWSNKISKRHTSSKEVISKSVSGVV